MRWSDVAGVARRRHVEVFVVFFRSLLGSTKFFSRGSQTQKNHIFDVQNLAKQNLQPPGDRNRPESDRNRQKYVFVFFLHFAFLLKLQLIVFSWFRGGLDFWGFEGARVCVMVGIDLRACAGAS